MPYLAESLARWRIAHRSPRPDTIRSDVALPGESQSSEKFSAEAPGGTDGSRGSGVGNEGLSDVKSYLGRDV